RKGSTSGLRPLTGRTPDKAPTQYRIPRTRRQRTSCCILAQPSTDQHVYAQSAVERPGGNLLAPAVPQVACFQ
ncbi:MAG TPA: hypothetical protein VF953_09535, partial [Terriglobales bacterium]